MTSFSADRGSSRYGSRSGPHGRSGGSHYMSHVGSSQFNGDQHVYSLRDGAPTYSLSGPKQTDNYHSNRVSQPQSGVTATAAPPQMPPANLGEKRNYSQSSLSGSASYPSQTKVSRWGDAPSQQQHGYAPTAQLPPPPSAQANGYQAWTPSSQLPTPPLHPSKAPPSGGTQWNNYPVAQQTASAAYAQPAAYSSTVTAAPPPPPPTASAQNSQQVPTAQSGYGAQTAPYTQYGVGQAGASAYPQAYQQSWPTQPYSGY